jgi:5'-phosphate synthase pdxT subunit
MTVRIGVLALQGAFIEHIHQLRALGAETAEVRTPAQLEGLDGLIIPGGESTVIGKLAVSAGLIEPLRAFAQARPTWGTCAGLIFLARDIGHDRQPILGVMNVQVNRNAFGRQIDSFETALPIAGMDAPFPAVFIRAPLITEAGEGVEVLATLDDPARPRGIVAAQQGHLLATAFHPEVTGDPRFHARFLALVSRHAEARAAGEKESGG